ncbi:MAG TPA: cytochrome c [Chitinophagaceae bacterium]|jgi:mono/diheme cytochrome c family protein|nr:cytochrome c [Chitinophagaceae bacterium]
MKRKIKTILKWTGITLLTLVVILAVLVAARQNMHYEAPYPDIQTSTDSAVIAHGRHLVISSAHCIDCHSKANADSLLALGQEVPLSGGVNFVLPLGTIYSKNITPDQETGIGKYSDRELARTLRYGVKPDGTVLYEFMQFHNTSDEDLAAILSYLRSQKPVYNKVPENQLNLLGNIVKAFLVKPVGPTGDVPKSVHRDTTAAYGHYLTHYMAECNGCHTKRDMSGKFIGEPFAGGNEIEGYITPNLTPDSSSRIFGWSEKQFIDRFRMGRLKEGSVMPWSSFKRMTDDELKAIYRYLKTLKPVKEDSWKNTAKKK